MTDQLSSSNRRAKQPERESGLRLVLRAADQAAVAGLVLAALGGMGVYWIVQGGLTGGLIEIDRAPPLVARFQVDVNSAGWPELSQLPEVGETLARRIVESRDADGRYGDLNDLLRVNGIGPRTLERMKPYLLPMPDQDEVVSDFVESIPVH
jgi:competence protein ComEA